MTDFHSSILAGLQFWRCASRKLYAVAQKNLKDGGDSEPVIMNLTDSDPDEEDFERPAKKKIRKDASEKQLDTIWMYQQSKRALQT